MIVRGTGCRDCGDEVSMLVLTYMYICMCACVHAADADVRQIFTHRLLSSSFLGLPYRILNMNHKKELPRSLWVIGEQGFRA